jgi:branched-chain amino acid transport system substrate-binding protein
MKPLIGIAGAAIGVFLAGQAWAQAGEPFKIGAIFPMSGPGAPTGVASEAGARLAIKEINAQGGILGRQVQLIVGDDTFDPTQSVSLAKRFSTSDKVQAVLGPQAGTLAVAVGPAMAEGDVAFFTAGSTGLMTPQAAPTGFSVSLIPEDQAILVIDWAVDVRKAKSVAYIGDNGSNSKTMAARFKAYAEERKLPVVAMEQFEFGSSDVTPQVLNLRRAAPEVVLLNGQTAPDQARVLKAIDEVGWKTDVVGTTAVTALYQPIKQVAGTAVQNVKVGVQIKSISYCSGDAPGSSDYARFLERLKAETPSNFDKMPVILSAWMYDGVKVIKAAAEGAKSTSGKAMTQWLETNRQGVAGVTGLLKSSGPAHFLARPETFTLVEKLDEMRADGLYKRAGC